ncbi:MAG: terpene cyclase/mutase family protein [Deltaproteobacteria bacterium]|nr:terpene cyclase/mutase family protein [Deltaproteobacteria bacterium]
MSSHTFLHDQALHNNKTIDAVVKHAQENIIRHCHDDGYWWYTLETNDSINAEFIMLLQYLSIEDHETIMGLCRWIIKNQNPNGSWSIYFDDEGDVSTTVECYLALKMAGYAINHPSLSKARDFILQSGGITKVRVFTRIHLALFGLVDWSICPNMPVALMQLPEWTPVNIYEFSSWARASIVPLLVIMDTKQTRAIPGLNLDELYAEKNIKTAKWQYDFDAGLLSVENVFLQIDKALKVADRLKLKPLGKMSLRKCEEFIRNHLAGTEDIYPAMFYGILALDNLGYDVKDQLIEKVLLGLKSFHVIMTHNNLNEIPFLDSSSIDYNVVYKAPQNQASSNLVYQQCCISPVWDTAWAAVALLESGLHPSHPLLIKTAKWLLSKEINDVYGDWAIKNPGIDPGGWSFEFYNKYYPDLDDTIEVLTLLHNVDLPYRELKKPIERGLNWLLSMQCKNGGFAAFDKDNDLTILNKLPFSDHGACLDPPTVDITSRVISFLINVVGYKKDSPAIQKAADFIVDRQEKNGSFWGRWGVNYIYGTWCVLEGLGALDREKDKFTLNRTVHWLKSIQNPDGGFGESCQSYKKGEYVPLNDSVPSQTAWALMGLISAGQAHSESAKKAVDFLMRSQNQSGGWDERHFTGTGFPGHFYILYHGYKHYFPLLALSKYKKTA